MAEEYDVAVIGGGGAGLTAAIYTARADLKTIIFEKNQCGGQIAITHLVENFPGFPEGLSGPEIASLIEQQAEKNGAVIEYASIETFTKENNSFTLKSDEKEYKAKTIILASGAQARKLGLDSELAMIGKGVSYCAVCDAPFFRNKKVAVIGGGDAAIQEAIYLTKFAEKVYVIHRRDELRAGSTLKKRALENEKIEFVWNSVVSDVEGNPLLNNLVLKNVKTEELSNLNVNGAFVFIGHDPVSGYVPSEVKKDESGYVLADKYETSCPGVFAAGEVRSGATWQLVAACGEGCSAGLAAEHYINNL